MRRTAPARRSPIAGLALATGCLAALAVPSTPASADVVGPTASATRSAWTAGSGTSYADAGAAGGTARLTWSNGTGRSSLVAPAGATTLTVRARGDQCAGAPVLSVTVDGRALGRRAVSTSTWATHRFSGTFAAGARTVELTFDNDHQGSGCDRNLRLDTLAFSAPTAVAPPPPVAPPTANPLAGVQLHVDPQSHAARTAAALRSSDPAGAALFDKIAQTPGSEWIGDWVPTAQVTSLVAGKLAAAGSAVPTFVLYAVPQRDCGSYSAGGLRTPAAYGAWVRAVAAGLGTRRAVVVLEPDALGLLDCLSATDQAARLALLRDAVDVLATAPGAVVYLDAGNSTWKPVADMAARLRSAGVARTRGFALNVSNFNPTANELAYGDALSAALGGARFVVDTSRNGRGPAPTWCNPPGQGLGARPTTATGSARADAYLWVKRVGESDGTCNGGPPAGTWWPDHARGLAERAAW